MTRSSRVLASLAALSLVLAACGGSDSDTASESTLKTIADGKLTVCSDAPYEPFEFQDENGVWTGFDMDLMRGIAEDNGLELEVTVQPFDGIWLAPQAGTCDAVASSMTINDERKQNADFTEGYFDSYQSLLVRTEDKDTLNSLESIAGKTIAVQTGTTGEAFAKENAPTAKIQSFDDASAMFLALESKQVDGVLQDFPINAFRAVKQGTSAVSAEFKDVIEQYGFSVAKGNTELLAAMNASLAEMRENGKYDEIFAKYFGASTAGY